MSDIKLVQYNSDCELIAYLGKRLPFIIKDANIGCCKEKWSWQYLADKVGDAPVQVHVAPNQQMDFINKNFIYRSLPFNELLKRINSDIQDEFFIAEDEKYYLRALGNNPRKDIADFTKDFPQLASDVTFPHLFEEEDFFSSVFRISSKNVQLWTHYDIMDNILIQVKGDKKVTLFPPYEAEKLYLNGDKSEVLDIDHFDEVKFPLFVNVKRYDAILSDGDILFIPALWFHNVSALTSSVAVNVFWKHLDAKFYDAKDVYGNKDLIPATRAFQVMNRALKILDELPNEYKDFYAKRIVMSLKQKAYSNCGATEES